VPVEWTGLGPELLLRIDRGKPEPLRSQLEREMREAIRGGRLQAGQRLPSSRALAVELGVSRGLVLDCYRQLQAEGYLSSRGGSATRVAAGAQSVPRAAAAREPTERLAVDFMPGLPDLTSFPRRDWVWAMRESCQRATVAAFGYGDPRGSPELRNVLAAYLRRVRAAVADPDDVVICAGFAQALNLVLRALARQGVRKVAIEDPGDLANSAVSRRSGLEVVPVAVDADGLDVGALALTGARAVVLTPAHQAPTGVVLASERRQALITWALEQQATIIEDDYDAEFRYDREAVGSLQGLAPDHVVLVGTASKTLAPTLRLGWLISPRRLVAAIAEEKQLADRGSPGLEQLTLATLIESGRYDRHLRRMRAIYAARRDVLVRSLAEQAPAVELAGLAAGFHAVARLPERLDETAIVAAARQRSIGLYGMSDYRSSGATHPPELVLGFGNLASEAIERGVRAIADLLGSTDALV
jgi:GntR family transcriptional regulator/MocR family aminotransferase